MASPSLDKISSKVSSRRDRVPLPRGARNGIAIVAEKATGRTSPIVVTTEEPGKTGIELLLLLDSRRVEGKVAGPDRRSDLTYLIFEARSLSRYVPKQPDPGCLGTYPGPVLTNARSTTFCGRCAEQLLVLYKQFSLLVNYSTAFAKMLLRRVQKAFVEVEGNF